MGAGNENGMNARPEGAQGVVSSANGPGGRGQVRVQMSLTLSTHMGQPGAWAANYPAVASQGVQTTPGSGVVQPNSGTTEADGQGA